MARKLAAILAADVVGYSMLMERDETGTFARLKAHRGELLEPEIKRHYGRVFKLMGDGLLAEFPSVVEAVECAVAVQKEMAKRNAGVAQGERIDLRIGVNLGDVIVEGKDRHGEGVNIAARLQQLAEPGGICVSQTVIDHLGNKLPVDIEAMGERQVKNIARPIAVYRVLTDPAEPRRATGGGTGRARLRQGPLLAAAAILAAVALGIVAWLEPWKPAVETRLPSSDKPSLVVLPFANLSDDVEQGYLADGITEDLTTDLARIPGLFVISRTAAFRYKDKQVDPAQVAAELGVHHIVEGSVRRAGSDLRINAQLIDAKTGGHVWAERFDGAFADVFALQNSVVKNVAGALELRLVAESGAAGAADGTTNPTAYDALLKGLEQRHRGMPGDVAAAAKHFEQAIALDPNFGRAYAELAALYWQAYSVRALEKALGVTGGAVLAKIDANMKEAAKHPSAEYYRTLASLLRFQMKSDEAVAAAGRAIALDPSNQASYEAMSYELSINGRADEAGDYLDTAWRLDPRPSPFRSYLTGLATFGAGRFEDAAAALETLDFQSADIWSDYYSLMLLTAAYGHLGRSAGLPAVREKLSQHADAVDESPFNGLFALMEMPFKEFADAERLLDGLRKAGVPELLPGIDPRSKDRLTGAEIRALVFGHELQGRRIEPEILEYIRITSADGITDGTVGSERFHGYSQVHGDFLCTWIHDSGRACGVFFRNPGGTFENRNEYLFIRPWDRVEFSAVK